MADDVSQAVNRAGMDPRRLVVIFLIAFGVVFGMFLEHILAMIWAQFTWADPEVIEGLGWRVTTLLGFGLSLGTMLLVWFHPRLHTTSMEISGELMKVTWPSWGETRVGTLAVVIASLVAAGVLFVIDTVAYKLMVEWLPRVWGKL